MMQVRSAMRERELSIRQAIGASRLRLARHLLSEAVLLAAAGGTLASLVIFNAPTIFSRLSGQPIPVQLQERAETGFFHDCDLYRNLPVDEPGLRIPAGASFQSSCDHFMP